MGKNFRFGNPTCIMLSISLGFRRHGWDFWLSMWCSTPSNWAYRERSKRFWLAKCCQWAGYRQLQLCKKSVRGSCWTDNWILSPRLSDDVQSPCGWLACSKRPAETIEHGGMSIWTTSQQVRFMKVVTTSISWQKQPGKKSEWCLLPRRRSLLLKKHKNLVHLSMGNIKHWGLLLRGF